MRVLKLAMMVLMSSALVPAFAEEGPSPVPNQPQMTPVQPERSPVQSEQSRGQDQKSAEDVQVGRDWKAQGAANHAPGQPDTKSNETTTGTSSQSHEPGKAGGVSVGQQERKPVDDPAATAREPKR